MENLNETAYMQEIERVFNAKRKELNAPPWAFIPDNWNLAFLRGLGKVAQGWKGKKVWEIGVGTGFNLSVLFEITQDVEWYFSDYNPLAVPFALKSLDHSGLNPLFGSWDLVTPPEGDIAPEVNAIFACIPQVPVPPNIDILAKDNLAQYYDPTKYPGKDPNSNGLAINRMLLEKARSVLIANGTVTLNLAGRPGILQLKSLFLDAGYQPQVLWSETISQHPGTSLAPLAKYEDNGHTPFEFFSDLDGTIQISASEAEQLRIRHKKLYHKIYVIEGSVM